MRRATYRPWYTTGTLVTLDGSDSHDPDGTIASYLWEQVSGPSVTIQNAAAAITAVTPANDGTYLFRLTVSAGADMARLVVTP